MSEFGAERRRAGLADLALAGLAAALTLAANAGLVAATLRGGFADPDDAMRLAEVHAWLSGPSAFGQVWFDMTAPRLDPPLGSVLHWSRLVDLPLAGAIRIFGLFVDPAAADRLAAVAVPGLWLAMLFFGMLRLVRLVVGPDARTATLIGVFLSGAMLVQVLPGRIGHHAPATLALIFAAGCIAAALDARRACIAAVAGVLVALSLAMSLETLPFLAVLSAYVVVTWIRRGWDAAPLLAWFAGGLAATLPAVFGATVAPQHRFAPVCDAFGAAHAGAGLIGAAGCLALAAASRRLRSWPRRSAAALAVAALVLAYVAFAYPACLHSPFAAVDPLVRALWLDHVVESLPLTAFVRSHPLLGLAIVLPLSLGALGAGFAAFRARGVEAERLWLVATLAGTGLALAFWQVRVLGATAPFALCGGVHLVDRLRRRLQESRLSVAAAMSPLAVVFFGSTSWVLALPIEGSGSAVTALCLQPEALAPLAELPGGSVVAPIDIGSHLIAATRLSPFAAPYHRNNDGNRFALSVFLARPDAAATLLQRRHVDYVVTCPDTSEMTRLAARGPDGLAAMLAAGAVPAFLRPLPLGATPLRVYAVTSQTR